MNEPNYKEINTNLPFDISVEALAAALLELNKDLTIEQIMVRPQGHLNRAAGREIIDISGSNYNSEGKEIIYIDINREGIFDALPEMLFLKLEGYFEDEVEKAQEIWRQKEQARRFFLPFEEEFYQTRIKLEVKENTASKDLNAWVLKIFGIDLNEIPEVCREHMLSFAFALPFMDKIVGDHELTSAMLESVIKKKVIISPDQPKHYDLPENSQSKLGDSILGDNLLLGDIFSDGIRSLQISICDVSPQEIEDWIHGGALRKLVEEKLFLHLMPAGENYEINILISESDGTLTLSDDSTLNILGYTSII